MSGFPYKPNPNDFLPTLTGERRYLKSLIRYTFWLVFFFSFVFGVSFVFFLRENPSHEMIDLRERDILEAVKWLQQRSLKPIISERIDPAFPRYQVIEQDPSPGSLVKENRSVSLVISYGENRLAMPDYRGNNYSQAQQALLSYLSGYGNIPQITKVEKFSDLPEGQVVDHYPRFNQPINFQERFIFVVSRGIIAEQLVADNYLFREYLTVEEELIPYGIRVTAEYVSTSDRETVGKIIEQSVVKGSPLNPGDSILFTVGFYDNQSQPKSDKKGGVIRLYKLQVPALSTQDEFTKKLNRGEIYIPDNRTNNIPVKEMRSVSIERSDQTGSLVIFQDRIPSGERISIPYRTVGQGMLRVIIDGKLFDTVSFD